MTTTPVVPDDMKELSKAITTLIAPSRFRGVAVILDPKTDVLTWTQANINPGVAVDLISSARQDMVTRILTRTEAEKEAFRKWEQARRNSQSGDPIVN